MAIPDLAHTIRGVVNEDTTVTLLARIMIDASNTLTAAVQSDFSAITYTVYANGAVVTSQTSLTVSSVIYNSLQGVNGMSGGTSIWGVDDTGFNFKCTIAASSFPTGGTTYQVAVKFTLTGGAVFFAVYEIVTRDLQAH